MLLSALHYDLPPERIAQVPAQRRDASRLLVLDRRTGKRRHERFDRLAELLPPGALLILNDTRVLPARLTLRRRTGGRVEALFLRSDAQGSWEVMLTGSARLRVGEELLLDSGLVTETADGGGASSGGGGAIESPCEARSLHGIPSSAAIAPPGPEDLGHPSERLEAYGPPGSSPYALRLKERVEAGVWRAVPEPAVEPVELLNRYGRTPLPPYIARDGATSVEQAAVDADRYQTIYARSGGAVAAPTAGLHFTPEVFASLRAVGIETAYVTLHVGVGTFAPIRCADLREHVMHAEWYDLPAATAAAVNAARAAGRPIIAVGTTSARVLESCADDAGAVTGGSGWTRLFIYPPYGFRAVDGMLTNFHLPGSTLLAMIFALAGRDAVLAAYNEAVAREYRFYSYGDAMLIV